MKNRLYNLDALRFIAAWIVLLCHVEVLKPYFGIASNTNRFFVNSAQIAVTFFFVLSGFLITWLLLGEKRKNQEEKIDAWRFYRKRILRIWPLYYLVIFLGFFVFRQIPFFNEAIHTNYFIGTKHSSALIYYILFLPNYAGFRFGSTAYIGQVWSLGVEEFFYLFFPIAVYFIPMKRMFFFLISSSILFIVISILVRAILEGSPGKLEQLLYVYADKYRLYSFTLGGLAAYFYLETSTTGSIKKYLSNRFFSYVILAFAFGLILVGRTFSIATQQVYSLIFSLLLLSVLLSGIKPWLLNNAVSIYLGRISYGIYMLHAIAIVIVLKGIYPALATGIKWVDSLSVYLLATIVTIVLAMISWHFYEKIFLRFRIKKDKTG